MKQRMYEFTTGIETSTQPDAGTPTQPNDLLTKGFFDANALTGRSGNTPLNTADTSKSVSFNNPFPALTEYEVFAIIKDTTMTPGDQNKFPINITAQDENGFTAHWGSAIGSTTAVLSWIAVVKND